jgi:hypothetical protein
LAAVALLVGATVGCGFSDQLTTRGFIQAADRICGETIVQTAVLDQQARQGPQPPAPAETIQARGGSYGEAAARIARLDISDDDVEMHAEMIKVFNEAARRLAAASELAGAGDPDGEQEALEVFAGLTDDGDRFGAYGFRTCAGRGGNPPG